MKTLPRWLKNTIREADKLKTPLPFARAHRTPVAIRESGGMRQRPEMKSA